jgi:ankyrin repeat protein
LVLDRGSNGNTLLDLAGSIGKEGNLKVPVIAAREFYRPHGEFSEWNKMSSRQEITDESFTYACRNGRTSMLGFLLERGADIQGEPYQGTGLIWAAFKGREETVRWLVEDGADINQQGNFGGRGHGVGVTALHLAVQEGEIEKVRFLVELGARADIEDRLYSATAVGWAEFFGYEKIAEYLRGILPDS